MSPGSGSEGVESLGGRRSDPGELNSARFVQCQWRATSPPISRQVTGAVRVPSSGARRVLGQDGMDNLTKDRT